MTYVLIFLGLFAAELLYFRIAEHFNITDVPNERSSHLKATIRGGGVVFYIAVVFFFFLSGFKYPWFFLGTSIVSIVSFFDDIYDLPSRLRLGVQLGSVGLILVDAGALAQPLWWLIFFIIVTTGVVNVFNFMDGINGITGFYGLVTLATLAYLNTAVGFADGQLAPLVILSLIVLGFFNFRRSAACFPGDVGSVSLACVIVFLLLRLILETQNYYFILLLAVYGVDASLTIFRRLTRGENILEPHRSHLYQWLVKPGPFSHLQVAGIYAAVQLGVNLLVIATWRVGLGQLWVYAMLILAALSVCYLLIRKQYGRRYRLS